MASPALRFGSWLGQPSPRVPGTPLVCRTQHRGPTTHRLRWWVCLGAAALALGVWTTVTAGIASAQTRVEAGWLGTGFRGLTPERARELGVAEGKGVLLFDLVADGPAAKAGLRRSDVLLSVDGRPLTGTEDLRRALELSGPGQSLRLVYIREKREHTLEVTLGKRPAAGRGCG